MGNIYYKTEAAKSVNFGLWFLLALVIITLLILLNVVNVPGINLDFSSLKDIEVENYKNEN